MAYLSVNAAEKILKAAGAERVSNKAAEEFAEFIDHIALTLAREVVDASKHANRLTVKEEDVKFVERKRIKDI